MNLTEYRYRNIEFWNDDVNGGNISSISLVIGIKRPGSRETILIDASYHSAPNYTASNKIINFDNLPDEESSSC